MLRLREQRRVYKFHGAPAEGLLQELVRFRSEGKLEPHGAGV